MKNFVNTETGEEVYVPRYRSKVVNLEVQYFDHNWMPLKNLKKIDSKVSSHGIKTDTKSR